VRVAFLKACLVSARPMTGLKYCAIVGLELFTPHGTPYRRIISSEIIHSHIFRS
jgi:hypothetical protein